MGLQYQHWVVHILGVDLVVSGMCTGTAVGVKQIYKAAEPLLPLVITMRMPQSGVLGLMVSKKQALVW